MTSEEYDGDATVLLSKPGGFQPNGHYLGSFEIYENMHYEMDIEIHSISTITMSGVLDCTNGSSYDYFPRIAIHPYSSSSSYSIGFYVNFGHEYDWTREGLDAGTTHRLEIDITRDTYTITQDGVVLDETYLGHATGIHVDCYSWNTGYWDHANVTVSNLLVTTSGMVLPIHLSYQMLIIELFDH